MKLLWSIFALLLGISSLSAWAQAGSPEEFIASVKTAMQEKSAEKLAALTYTGRTGIAKSSETPDDSCFRCRKLLA
jgi:hypothetical protein